MSFGSWMRGYSYSGSGSGPDNPDEQLFLPVDLAEIAEALADSEQRVADATIEALQQKKPGRNRKECDAIFYTFTALMERYRDIGLSLRAAALATEDIIPHVMDEEHSSGAEFHKGALFYDTGLAFFFAGDTDRCSYYLALANEEDVLTGAAEGTKTPRGLHNTYQGTLSHQLAHPTIDSSVAFLNEPILDPHGSGGFARVFGRTLDAGRLNIWRKTLGDTHHFEIFRILQELEVFDARHSWSYPRANDNPYLLLRLAKVLAHAAQWFESYLTALQGNAFGKSLAQKLRNDPRFGPLHTAAGGKSVFPGSNPSTPTDVDAELHALLTDFCAASDAFGRQWRAFRIAYIVRNAMSHQIDDTLLAYQDRDFVRQLIQQVLLASFMLRELFTGQFP